MLGQLNSIQIDNLLTSQVLGKIACTDGLQPYIVPVTYSYDGKYIYGQTNDGKKLDILRKNPRVCFEVDCVFNMRHWQSVIILGTFEELENDEAEQAHEILFNRVYPLMTSNAVHTYGHNEEFIPVQESQRKNVMYRIKIENVSGRFEKE